jgi:NADPH:quinone reductase-like Zn-dependent oxidoreductase
MKAIVVADQAAGTAGMKLVERPAPEAAINDVVVQIHASAFISTELGWPSTWTDRIDRDRTPSILGHDLAGVVAAIGNGTTGLSVGQRVFGLADWYRDGTLAEYVAVEARNLAPLRARSSFASTSVIALVSPSRALREPQITRPNADSECESKPAYKRIGNTIGYSATRSASHQE